MSLDHSRAPALEALLEFREQGYTPFNPPGPTGRGAGSTSGCSTPYPAVLPGGVITDEVLDYLREVAASTGGPHRVGTCLPSSCSTDRRRAVSPLWPVGTSMTIRWR